MLKLLTTKKSFWHKLIDFRKFFWVTLKVAIGFVFCFSVFIIDSLYAESGSACLSKSLFFESNSPLFQASKITTRNLVNPKISIDVVYDKMFLEKYGVDLANIKIANIIKASNQIFLRNLGVELNVINHGYSDNFDYADNIPRIYSELFKEKETKKGSILHLFSGRDFGNLHGAAYEIGTVCRGAERSFSFSTSNTRSNLLNVFMHEILHNLGATHIISSPKSIMSPNLNSESTTFMHNDTKAELALFLNAFGGCANLTNAININMSAPNSLDVDISKRSLGVKRRRISFDISVKLNKIPLPLSVNLLYKKRRRASKFRVLKTKEANQFGKVTIRSKRAGIYKIGISDFLIDARGRVFRFTK